MSMRRTIGRVLISAAAIQTAVVPILADWNETHVFSDQWSPHARFHGIVSLAMNATLAPVALWMVWRRRPEPGAAAVISIAYWGSFFGAALAPGTDVTRAPRSPPVSDSAEASSQPRARNAPTTASSTGLRRAAPVARRASGARSPRRSPRSARPRSP